MIKLPRGIKKEPASLVAKSFDSLTLAIELFNRPSDFGRRDSVLILLDHAFEMLLKAGILHKGARIRDPGMSITIGFGTCVARAKSNPACRFLSDDEGIVLLTINGQRDAAQHHLSDISEEQLYLHVQSGVTLFRTLVKRVFNIDLTSYMPRRVLPLSTVAFSSIEALFDEKVSEVQKLLTPDRRRRQEAIAALRPLAIMNRAIQGEEGQPSEGELNRMADRFKNGEDWRVVFLAINLVECVADEDGPTLSLRIVKKEGISIRIVPTDTQEGTALAVRRVNELDYYNLSPTQMAEHLDLTAPKFFALRKHLGLNDNLDYFKLIVIGSQRHQRFSQNGLKHARLEASKLTEGDWTSIWETYRPRTTRSRPISA